MLEQSIQWRTKKKDPNMDGIYHSHETNIRPLIILLWTAAYVIGTGRMLSTALCAVGMVMWEVLIISTLLFVNNILTQMNCYDYRDEYPCLHNLDLSIHKHVRTDIHTHTHTYTHTHTHTHTHTQVYTCSFNHLVRVRPQMRLKNHSTNSHVHVQLIG